MELLWLMEEKNPENQGFPTSWSWGTRPIAVGSDLSFRDKIWACPEKGYATWCTTLLRLFLYISSKVLLISCICGVRADKLPLTSVVTCLWQWMHLYSLMCWVTFLDTA